MVNSENCFVLCTLANRTWPILSLCVGRQNELANIVTLLLGISIGADMMANDFSDGQLLELTL